jgi:hypothetical protein
MKKILLLLIIICFSFSTKKEKYTFFRIDENIKLENIKFGKEVERWNRIIKVKNTKSINFKLNVNGKEHEFELNRNSILNLNSISLRENQQNANSLKINRGHTIIEYEKKENLDFSVIINCFSRIINGNEIKTGSEEFDKDLKSNPSFFF